MDARTITKGAQLALRASVAAAAAVALAQLFHLSHPIYAFLAAVIVTDLIPSESRRLALGRFVATAVGAILGAALSPFLPPGPLAIGFSILIAMLICQWLEAPEVAKVAGFICGIVVLEHSPEPWLNAFYRFVETALGVIVALAVSYVPKLIRMEEPEKEGLSDGT